MDFKSFWFGMSQEDRAAFAGQVNRSPGYLQLVAGGFRRASPVLANTIHDTTEGKVTREEMRGDIFGSPRPSAQQQPSAPQ
jgi:DNA-binding transcriptional regulator YdaS (Cro superfamily)